MCVEVMVCYIIVVFLRHGVVQQMLLQPRHLLFHENPDCFTFLVLAYSGCPGKEAIERS